MSASRSWFLAVAIATVACIEATVASAADKDEAVKNELADLAGQWDFQGGGASGEARRQPWYQGGRNGDEKFELYVLKIEGAAFVFADTEAGKTTAKIDPTRTPKTIDLTDPKGRTYLGVYELTGDKLLITVAVRKTRPKKVVEYNLPSGQACAIYKRASK